MFSIPTSNRRLTIIAATALLGVTVSFALHLFSPPAATTATELKEQTFANLAKIRMTKKEEVITRCQSIRQTALSIGHDAEMLRLFEALHNKPDDNTLGYAVDQRYATTYGDFYDILFVDSTGLVFHSVKQEDDYRTNLFTDNADPKLTKALKRPGEDHFVEFNYYPPSAEAAAFSRFHCRTATVTRAGSFFNSPPTASTPFSPTVEQWDAPAKFIWSTGNA